MMAKNNETTTKFKVDISELKSAMQTARKQVALANSEFKAASSSMDNWSKSSDGISAKLKQLNSNLNSQKKVLAEYEKTLEEVKAEYGENSDEAQEYQTKLNNQKSVVNNLNKEIKNYEDSLDTANQAEKIAAKTGRDATEVFDDLADSTEDAGDSAKKAANDGFTVMKAALANLVADGISKAVDALKDFAKASVQTGIDFEAAMSEVAAISGANAEDLALLEKTAKEFGSTTVFSASEAAQALKYMALAGWDAKTSTSALGGVLDLAASAGMDLAQASDMVTDYLSAFGLAADKSTYFADLLAFSQSNANTSAEQLGDAFKNCAANLNAAGQDVETVTSLLSMMANQGYKGSQAGTALTAVMRDMSAKMFTLKDATMTSNLAQLEFKSVTGDLNDMLGQNVIKIGKTLVAVSDASGNYRDLTDILKDVEKATYGLGDAERATALAGTFTADSTKGMNLILNAGVGEAEKFEKALRGASGTATKMGETMNNNVSGDLKALESAMEGVKIEVFKQLQPTIRKFIQYLTKDGVKNIKELASKFVELAKKAMPLVKKAFEVLIKLLGFAADNFETLVKVLFTAITVFKTLKAVMAIANTIKAFNAATAASTITVNAAQKAQLLWNASMSANPIGAVITAVALLVAGIVALTMAMKDNTESADLLTEEQRELVTAAEESAEAFEETKKAADDLAAAELANIDHTNTLWNELQSLTDENGKVQEGYEGRASYILGELNNALGTEYTMNGNIISQYQQMKDEIASLIEAKKAQMLLTAYEDTYREAIENVAEAEKARATQAQELAAQQAVYDKAQSDAIKARAELNKKIANAKTESEKRALASEAERVTQLEANAKKEKELLDEKQAAYNDSLAKLQNYYDVIDTYENASALINEGQVSEAVSQLTRLGSGFKTAASLYDKSAKEQKEILKQQVIDTQVNLELLEADYKEKQGSMTEAQKKQAEARIAEARKEAEAAKEEYVKVGGNLVRGMVEGVEGETWTLTDSIKESVEAAIKAAKDAAGIKSPSRVFKKEIGRYLGLGIAAGIDDSTKDVVKSVKNQVNDIKTAYGTASGELSVGTGGVGSGVGTGGVVNNFTQINNSPKALSRLEIYRQSKNLLGYAGGV